jgi:antitoxin YefM
VPTYLPITRARDELTSLPGRLAQEPGAVAVTRRGEPVLAILPWELYESLEETLEILGDEELMAALRQSLAEAAAGQTVPWEEVKAELGC